MHCMTIGSVTVDIIIQVSAGDVERLTMHNTDLSFMMLELGHKINADSISISVGGCAINAGVSMARLGHNVTPIIKINNDTNGNKVRELFEQENLNPTHIMDDATLPTATSVLLSSVEKDPTVFAYRGANTQLQADQIAPETLHGADLIYITSLSGNSAKSFVDVTKKAHDSGAFVASNPGILQIQSQGTEIVNSLPHITCLTINAREAGELLPTLQNHTITPATASIPQNCPPALTLMKSGLSKDTMHMSMATYMKTMTQLGLNYMVVTDGKNGVYMGCADGIYFAPSMPVQVAGTIGAGDALASTLTSYLAGDKSNPAKALLAGTINSASVVSYTDTHTGLLPLDELEKRITPDLLDNVIFMPYDS